MAEQAGSSGQHGKDPPHAADFLSKRIGVLQDAKQDIGTTLNSLHAGKLRLNRLEEHLVDVPAPDLVGAAREDGEQEEIRLAVYLYSMARQCRDIVEDKRFNAFLQSVLYTMEHTNVLLAAFNELADAWSAYEPVIGLLDVAAWGRDPSPDQIWTALKKPRREYIDALAAYYMQLLTVINKLEAADPPSPNR
jgi:hypothetical protein